MNSLEQMIQNSTDPRELKRALAVKLSQQGFPGEVIAESLQVSDSFVSKWKGIYGAEGLAGLQLGYSGREGYLSETAQADVMAFLRTQTHYTLGELQTYISTHYGVTYHSKESYYALMDAGGLSWKRNEASNPKRDASVVLQRQTEIQAYVKTHEAEIAAGERVVYVEDESHVLWGDVCGYIWGRTNEAVNVPITNVRERATYYGAVNYQTKTFVVQEYAGGNGLSTVDFVKTLQARHPGAKLTLLWDGASHHRYGLMREYLQTINTGLSPEAWPVTCVLLAPYAPDQNPVEDIWLKGKNYLRQHFFENQTFAQVKTCFFNFLNEREFDFPKLSLFGAVPQLI
jgi:putative transposase